MKKYEELFEKIAMSLGFIKISTKSSDDSTYSLGDFQANNIQQVIDFLISGSGHHSILLNCRERGWEIEFFDNAKYFHFIKKGDPLKVTQDYENLAYFKLIAMEAFLETFELDKKDSQ